MGLFQFGVGVNLLTDVDYVVVVICPGMERGEMYIISFFF